MDDLLPERPESEQMICENNEEADGYTVSCAISASGSAAESYCNNGLGEIQKEILYRDPEQQP